LAEALGEADVDGMLRRMSSRQLSEWMAYFAGKRRVSDILAAMSRDSDHATDPELAWSMVWGPPAETVDPDEDR
jgi:hypothetical protein